MATQRAKESTPSERALGSELKTGVKFFVPTLNALVFIVFRGSQVDRILAKILRDDN